MCGVSGCHIEEAGVGDELNDHRLLPAHYELAELGSMCFANVTTFNPMRVKYSRSATVLTLQMRDPWLGKLTLLFKATEVLGAEPRLEGNLTPDLEAA